MGSGYPRRWRRQKAWAVAGSLAVYPELADLLGERHRIIANDWQAANGQALIARMLRRTLEIIGAAWIFHPRP